MFSEKDKQQIAAQGLSISDIEQQLQHFKEGFPYMKLVAPASIGNGIIRLTADEKQKYIELWDNYLHTHSNVIKFVPASGAASRMFKDLFAFLNADYDEPTTKAEKTFFDNIQKFAFYKELDKKCIQNEKQSIDELIENNKYKAVVENLLQEKGLNYANKPKGLLMFHKEHDNTLTPIEEHLKEASAYTANNDKACIHFTVSKEYLEEFQTFTLQKIAKAKERNGVTISASFSIQSPATDTIAVDTDNNPFRNEDRTLLFRPGGHGALIQNLNSLDADIVFIKNIDNVCSNKYIADTIAYKKILAGILIETRDRIFHYIEKLSDSNTNKSDVCREVTDFIKNTLMLTLPDMAEHDEQAIADFLKSKLMRPIRVCGVVKNVGEPGGGPFIIEEKDNTYSLQILESSQIDMSNDTYKKMFEEGTHFNPVDIVCGLNDMNGEKYNLLEYIDTDAGFISHKSSNGKELKALELPGLWNGAMSRWTTLFVETPLITFNPVKTVNDLLRDEHQE